MVRQLLPALWASRSGETAHYLTNGCTHSLSSLNYSRSYAAGRGSLHVYMQTCRPRRAFPVLVGVVLLPQA